MLYYPCMPQEDLEEHAMNEVIKSIEQKQLKEDLPVIAIGDTCLLYTSRCV